jgi:hypothetical protein
VGEFSSNRPRRARVRMVVDSSVADAGLTALRLPNSSTVERAVLCLTPIP